MQLPKYVSLHDYIIHAFKADKNSKISIGTRNYRPHIFANLLHIWETILFQKVFIIALLQEAIYYGMFKYILVDSYMDTRIRWKLTINALDVQLFPFAETFVRLYKEGSVNKNNFVQIRDSIFDVLSKESMPSKYNSFDDYQMLARKSIIDYLLKHYFFERKLFVCLERKINVATGANPSQGLINLFSGFVKKDKKNRILYIFSALMQLLVKPSIEQHFIGN